MWSVSAVTTAEAVKHAVADERGQGALALLILIVIVAGWLALRATVRRLRQPPRA